MLRHSLMALVLLVLPLSVLAQDAGAPAGAMLEGVRIMLVGEAQRWASQDPVAPPAISLEMRTLTPTPETLAELRQALLQSQDGDPVTDLYVRYQLLQPLLNASAEQIRQVRDVLDTLASEATYQEFAQLTPRQQSALATPPSPETEPATTPAAGPVDEKLAADRRVLQNNVLVRQIELTISRLRLLTNDPQDDQKVLESLEDALRRGFTTYTDALSAIRLEIPEITPDRAKALYDDLRRLAYERGDVPVELVVPTQATLVSQDVSRFATESRTPAADLIQTVNLLATVARQPAMRMPPKPQTVPSVP